MRKAIVNNYWPSYDISIWKFKFYYMEQLFNLDSLTSRS